MSCLASLVCVATAHGILTASSSASSTPGPSTTGAKTSGVDENAPSGANVATGSSESLSDLVVTTQQVVAVVFQAVRSSTRTGGKVSFFCVQTSSDSRGWNFGC
jgi:hypothetical protein